MITGVLILCVLIMVSFFIWEKSKHPLQSPLTGSTKLPAHETTNNIKPAPIPAIADVVSITDVMGAEYWREKLSDFDQLHLALIICQKAMPVWEKYTSSQALTYHTSATEPAGKIDSNILQTALDAVLSSAQLQFPAGDNKHINKCYFNFVEPVIAIHDGNWLPSYPVKKIFLAVYCILKSIVEQNNYPGSNNVLSEAISQALDCIDITKLYTRQQIDDLLESYLGLK